MIYPSRYLMNLLWVAKLFMSLIAKFLHASLPFLASKPKSNSAWVKYTHTCAYTYAYTYLTQSLQHLRMCTKRHTLTHLPSDQHLCPPVHKSIFHEGRIQKCLVRQVWLLQRPKPTQRQTDILLFQYARASPLGDFHLSLTDRKRLGKALFTEERKSPKHLKCVPSSVHKNPKWHLLSVKLKSVKVWNIYELTAPKFEDIHPRKACIPKLFWARWLSKNPGNR